MHTVVKLEPPYVLGNAGFGYKFAVADGEGNIVVATNPVDTHSTVIIKAPFGASGEPSGPASGQAALLKSMGHVTCGCIAEVDGKKFLFAGKPKSVDA